jgi:hypothetical protein
MPLPKISEPIFELEVPSTGDKVKYRPFTVKEEKILLIAQESKDIDQIILAIKQIIGNCLFDYNIDRLAMFDMEYILLNIRAKAVNNIIEFSITDPDTEEKIDLHIDINEITIQKDPKHNNIIEVTDTIKLKMKYPSIEVVRDIVSANDKDTKQINSGRMLDVMVKCIDMVVDGEEVYKLSDFTDDEVSEFVDSLNSEVLQKIRVFFDTMPVMRFEKKYTNEKGDEKTFVAAGTETFFI